MCAAEPDEFFVRVAIGFELNQPIGGGHGDVLLA